MTALLKIARAKYTVAEKRFSILRTLKNKLLYFLLTKIIFKILATF